MEMMKMRKAQEVLTGSRNPLKSERGFTLLEVLVALAILGTAVTLIFQLYSANMRNIAASEDYISAVVAAEARMRELLDDNGLAVSNWSEMTEDGYRIDVAVAEVLQQRTGELPVMLLEIALKISWTQNTRQKNFTMRSMTLVKRKV